MTEPISNVVDLVPNAADRVRPKPLTVRNAGELEGVPVPEREWLIEHILVRDSVTLFSGAGGLGKSLLCLQLQVAYALGKNDWLGLELPGRRMKTLAIYCEDSPDEIHRRLYWVCRHQGVHFRDLGGRMLFLCRLGQQNNELVTFDGRGSHARRTALFHQIADIIRANEIAITIIDTASDTFGGNEIVRPQVRAFIQALTNLAMINHGGVILTAHPSRTGLLDRTGLSGSTAWDASVRARIFLTRPKTDQDADGDDRLTAERVLKIMKSNYGPPGGKVKLRWERGVYTVQHDPNQTNPWYLST